MVIETATAPTNPTAPPVVGASPTPSRGEQGLQPTFAPMPVGGEHTRSKFRSSAVLPITWYVSPSGNDAQDCQTPATACRTINVALADSGPGDTIVIAAGTYDEHLSIDSDITLIGAGPDATIIGGNRPQDIGNVITINSGTVVLSGVTVQNGFAYPTYRPGPVAVAAEPGGGIDNNGALTLVNSVITRNDDDVAGGGVYNGGALTVISSTISNNQTRYNGGGIDNSGAMTVTDSAITNNTTFSDSGGGVANLGQATLTRVTISGNHAGHNAGAIYNEGGALALAQSAVSGNAADNGDGGIQDFAAMTVTASTVSGNNGGITLLFSPQLWVTNSTISDNNGFGLFVAGGSADVSNTTISGNSGGGPYAPYGSGVASDGGAVTLANTLVAGNTSATGMPDCSGTLSTGGHNLIGIGGTCDGIVNGVDGDRVGSAVHPLDPHLGALQDNGGPTQTRALLPGSPAIDAGDPDGCRDAVGLPLSIDQRGYPRPYPAGWRCDIGAYEAGSRAPVMSTPSSTATPGSPTATGTAAPTRTPRPTLTPTATPPDCVVPPTPALTPLPDGVRLAPTGGLPQQNVTAHLSVAGTETWDGYYLWWDRGAAALAATDAGQPGPPPTDLAFTVPSFATPGYHTVDLYQGIIRSDGLLTRGPLVASALFMVYGPMPCYTPTAASGTSGTSAPPTATPAPPTATLTGPLAAATATPVATPAGSGPPGSLIMVSFPSFAEWYTAYWMDDGARLPGFGFRDQCEGNGSADFICSIPIGATPGTHFISVQSNYHNDDYVLSYRVVGPETAEPTATPTSEPTAPEALSHMSSPTITPSRTPIAAPAATRGAAPSAACCAVPSPPAPSAGAPAPVPPTVTPVPPTVTAIPTPHGMGIAPPVPPYATATRAPALVPVTKHPSSQRHPRAMRPSLTVSLPVKRGHLLGGSMVTISMWTSPHTNVAVSATLTHRVRTWVGKGHERHTVTVTRALFRATTHTKADAAGHARTKVRLAYNPPHTLVCALTIAARTATGTAVRIIYVTDVHVAAPRLHPRRGAGRPMG